MQVLVGDRFGNIITELQPQVGPMSWILNNIGKSALTLAKSDPKATETNLQIGNRVTIELDNGLPLWGGVMDLPRVWNAGTIGVTCYGIEHLLKRRLTRKNDAFYERPAGTIFEDLLRRNEQKDPMGITIGNVWVGGRSHWPRYHYKALWTVLTDSLRKIELCDFRFTPYVEAGKIQFRAEFFQVAGSDKTATVGLTEGANVSAELTLEEQGEVVNVSAAVGAGSTWGSERRVTFARDSGSVAKYGLLEDSAVYSSVSEEATLEMHARNTITQQSEPRKIFTLPVTDDKPGRFADYDLGDTVKATLPTFGFGGYAGALRILAREYDPATGDCSLVVEEQRSVDAWIYQDEPGEDT
jgi:hypothetical protein